MRSIFITFGSVFILLSLLIVQSCKEKPGPFDDNLSLVSASREITMTEANIMTLLNTAKMYYPGIADMIPEVRSGVDVYSVTYNTTFRGEPVLASGLIAIPTDPGTYPVLSYQNGTNTLNSNAPSVNPLNTLCQLLESISSTGYIVVIADYLGFGGSGNMVHPYLDKASTVQTLVDLLYALKEFDEDVAVDVNVSDDYFLLGYSQGGWATLALLDALENDYGSDFTVRAASCGAGPYDLNYFNSYVLGLTEYPMPVFLGYISNAYSEYNLFANPLTDLYNEPYASRIPGLYDGMHSSDQINSQLTVNIAELFKADYITGYSTSAKYQSVRNALISNSIEGWDTTVPLLFLHGTADDYVPPVLSGRMHAAMLEAGTSPLTCLYEPMQDLNHSEGIIPAGLAGLTFFKTYR